MKCAISQHKGKKVYNIKFYNLAQMYSYLKSDPKINYKIFPEPASHEKERAGENFFGSSLADSIEYLKDGYNQGLNNFLEASSKLSKIGNPTSSGKESQLSVYGNVAIPALVAQGVNECMLRTDVEDTKVIDVLFNLSYPAHTTGAQIRNRGLATLYIIKTLEKKGYLINFKAFELSKSDYEMFHLSIDLKKPGDLFLDEKKCYYPMVGKEFLRRILFRIMESTPLEDRDWTGGYGESCSSSEMRDFFKAKKKDIVISSPGEMAIRGNNIYEDSLSLIESLEIQDEFDVKKLKYFANKSE
ncbi:MAG: hypothetical protein J1F35_02165 [Erysipelotrichales bacterium]|nr:hypothetical protein [Erysipelotrichales bacterium]